MEVPDFFWKAGQIGFGIIATLYSVNYTYNLFAKFYVLVTGKKEQKEQQHNIVEIAEIADRQMNTEKALVTLNAEVSSNTRRLDGFEKKLDAVNSAQVTCQRHMESTLSSMKTSLDYIKERFTEITNAQSRKR